MHSLRVFDIMLRMNQIYKRKGSIVVREIAGETMLVPITGNLADMQKIFALDDVSALIWSLLDGTHGLQDLVQAVVESFDVTEDVATPEARAFLAELCEAGLVEQV